MSDDVLATWSEVKSDVAALEEDISKNLVKGNSSAGVRARRGLRGLRSKLTAIVKQSMAVAKQKKEEKAAAPKKEKAPKAPKAAKSA